VRVDAGIACSACKILVFPVRDVGLVLREIFFGEPKIYNVQFVTALESSHDEVVWLYVSVQKIARMDVLDPKVNCGPC